MSGITKPQINEKLMQLPQDIKDHLYTFFNLLSQPGTVPVEGTDDSVVPMAGPQISMKWSSEQLEKVKTSINELKTLLKECNETYPHMKLQLMIAHTKTPPYDPTELDLDFSIKPVVSEPLEE